MSSPYLLPPTGGIQSGVTGSKSALVKLLHELHVPPPPEEDTLNHTFLVYSNPIYEEANISYTLDQNQGIRIRLATMDGKHLTAPLNASRSEGHHCDLVRVPVGLSHGMYSLFWDALTGQQTIKILISR